MIICLDAGHGGTDSGAVGFGLKEKDWTLEMVKLVGKALSRYEGISLLYTRTDDRYVSINQRWQYANTKNADYFFSFHINSGGGSGFESFIDNNASAESKRIQSIITNDVLAFLKSYGIGAHGDATKIDSQARRGSIGVLTYTKMPAVLFENLFIDNKKENDLLKSADFKEKLANVYAKSIAKCLGLKEKASTPAIPEKLSDMYDLSYLKDGKLIGVISSRHPNEVLSKVQWAMEARANCTLLLKRTFDLRILQKALNDMFPEEAKKWLEEQNKE